MNAMVSKSVENTESRRAQSDRRLDSSVTSVPLCLKHRRQESHKT